MFKIQRQFRPLGGHFCTPINIDYTLRVVRYEVNAAVNPWGLALDGFVNHPERVQTYI